MQETGEREQQQPGERVRKMIVAIKVFKFQRDRARSSALIALMEIREIMKTRGRHDALNMSSRLAAWKICVARASPELPS